MNVACFTDAVVQAHLDRAVTHHVATDVSVVIAAKQEAPSIGDVIDRTRRYAGEILVVVGQSTDGTADVAAGSGASVLADGGRGKGEAIRRAIPHIRTPVTVFLDADGSHDPEDIPLLVEPILAGEADHVAASRLRGGSSELHGGFDEFLRLAGSSFITACINWRFNCQLSDSQNGFRAIRTDGAAAAGPAREHHDDRAGDDHQDAAPGMADGRSARATSTGACTAARTSASGATRPATACRSSSTCSSDDCGRRRVEHTVNILGIWDGHDSGAALLQDGELRFAVNEERLTPPQARNLVSRRDRSRPASPSPVCVPEQIDVVAASTSDPAKTLGRLLARQQGTLLRGSPAQGRLRVRWRV